MLMVMGGDWHGRDGWHHSSRYWKHWYSFKEQRVVNRVRVRDSAASRTLLLV